MVNLSYYNKDKKGLQTDTKCKLPNNKCIISWPAACPPGPGPDSPGSWHPGSRRCTSEPKRHMVGSDYIGLEEV